MAQSSSTLTFECLQQRAVVSVLQHYVSIFAVMQGLVLAMAALAFPEIIQRQAWSELLLWCVGIEASVLTTHANAVGSILLEGVPGLHDTVLPILISITHFLMFAVLRSPSTVEHWNWAFGSFALAAFFLVNGIIRRLRRRVYEPTVAVIISQYVAGLRRDTFGAAANAIIFIGYFIAIRVNANLMRFQWVFGVIAALLLVIPIAHNRRAGHLLANSVT